MSRSNTTERLRKRILAALKAKPLTTPSLATELNETMAKIRYHCNKLKDEGYLVSKLIPYKRLLYCVDDQMVITGDDYESCKSAEHDIRSFRNKVRVWILAKTR